MSIIILESNAGVGEDGVYLQLLRTIAMFHQPESSLHFCALYAARFLVDQFEQMRHEVFLHTMQCA